MSDVHIYVDESVAGEVLVRSKLGASTLDASSLSAATQVNRGVFSRVGALLVSGVAAFGMLGAPEEERLRTVYSRARRSQSSVSDVRWVIDSWTYSEDPASIEQVRALNQLLALGADEGLVLDLPE